MRTEILAYLNANKITGFNPSVELPWDSNGTPLYVKNFKSIYVDQDQVSQEPLIDVLNGSGVVNQITTVRAYVTTDAKQVPSNLSALIAMISAARLTTGISGVTQRTTQVTTTLQNDAQITEFEFSFRQLILN
jgi:hypothetical protein